MESFQTQNIFVPQLLKHLFIARYEKYFQLQLIILENPIYLIYYLIIPPRQPTILPHRNITTTKVILVVTGRQHLISYLIVL